LAPRSAAVSLVAAVVAFVALLGDKPAQRYHASTLWSWLTAGQLDFGLRILVDPLSVFMMLVVSGVGMLIVAYSIGYMDGDNEERRYFAYMALFVFSMLLLVQGGNLLMLLAGWGLVGGANAKSAQLPLQAWLPDAMEGPTPVSALIRAATMVTAGINLIVRTSPLFEAAPKVLELAGGLGAITLVMAGLIALVQTD